MFCFGCWAFARVFRAFGPSSFVPAGRQTLLFTAPQQLWRSKWPFGLASGPLLLRNGWSGLLRCHFWRSKWLLGPPGARNGCSGLPRCRQSARNGRLSRHRCRQSARNWPLWNAPVPPERSKWPLGHCLVPHWLENCAGSCIRNCCSKNICSVPRNSAPLRSVVHGLCMDMHRFTLVYIYIYMSLSLSLSL